MMQNGTQAQGTGKALVLPRASSSNGTEGCLWSSGSFQPQSFDELCDHVDVDVAIIGGGYTGLSTAYHLRRAEPGLRVAVLEAERIGHGASGRNAGFVISLFGASIPLMKLLHGGQRVREAHDFMAHAITELETTVADNAIECDYQRSGFLKVATSPTFESCIRKEVDLMQSLGIEGVEWIEKRDVEARIAGTGFRGALWEPGCGTLNPVKWLFGLAGLAKAHGAEVYEDARVVSIKRKNGRYWLTTPQGRVSARKIVYATNGYSHLVPGLKSKQLPAFTYVIATERLSDRQLASLRWTGREGIEDGLNFMHYYRLTPDNRLLVGGGPGVLPFGNRMDYDSYPRAWNHLEVFIHGTFPQLGSVKIEHKWGGAFSVTPDNTPQIGTLGSGDAVYSLGCTGHGVAMTFTNGQILRDLVLERNTALTDLWFVNRWSMPLPPEPARSLISQSMATYMTIEDWLCGRGNEAGSRQSAERWQPARTMQHSGSFLRGR
jgi:glycine/D-amino acid oxidase-like deaminating enzyme